MILNKAIVKKKANIHSRYRCPETTCFIPIFSRDFFRRSYDFKQSDSKNKKLIFTAGIVVQRQHHFFLDFHSLFFFSGGPIFFSLAFVYFSIFFFCLTLINSLINLFV